VFCSWLQVMGPVSTELILLLKLNTAGLLEEILTCLWNLKIHYCVYRSLKHLNLFFTLVPCFFNIHFNTVSHLHLSHPRGLFPSSCSKIFLLKVTYLSSFIWSSQYFLVNNTKFEAPHYAVFSSYLLLLVTNMF
jgi:hypothetical protein